MFGRVFYPGGFPRYEGFCEDASIKSDPGYLLSVLQPPVTILVRLVLSPAGAGQRPLQASMLFDLVFFECHSIQGLAKFNIELCPQGPVYA